MSTSATDTPRPATFRYPAAIAIAALVAAIAAVPLAASQPYLAPILLVPLAVAGWAWRAGTDADAAGVRVRALLGQRRVPWSRISGLVPAGRRRVAATLTDGSHLVLPAVTPADLPRLVAASGGELARAPSTRAPAEPPAPEPAEQPPAGQPAKEPDRQPGPPLAPQEPAGQPAQETTAGA